MGGEGHVVDEAGVPAQRRPGRRASPHVPEADDAVAASRGKGLAVGGVGHRGHHLLVPLELGGDAPPPGLLHEGQHAGAADGLGQVAQPGHGQGRVAGQGQPRLEHHALVGHLHGAIPLAHRTPKLHGAEGQRRQHHRHQQPQGQAPAAAALAGSDQHGVGLHTPGAMQPGPVGLHQRQRAPAQHLAPLGIGPAIHRPVQLLLGLVQLALGSVGPAPDDVRQLVVHQRVLRRGPGASPAAGHQAIIHQLTQQ